MQSPSEMRLFVEVARQSGFSAAARTLNVSKSHVSKKIRDLEERLGVWLLHRTTREVSLTEAGEVYFRHCRQILSDIEEAERAVSELRASPRGKRLFIRLKHTSRRLMAPSFDRSSIDAALLRLRSDRTET